MSVQPAGTEVTYTVTFLEMKERPSFDWPNMPGGPPHALIRAEDPPVWYFRALYDAVGRDYAWEDMPRRPDAELADWLNPERMALYTLLGRGWPQGFFMLETTGPDSIELAYLGLVPEAVGQGLGTWLLKTAILTAWQRDGLASLTVNTCTLDHPRALALYQRHGFRPVRREERTRTLTRPRDPARIPG